MKRGWKVFLFLAVLAGIGGWLAIDHQRGGRVVEAWNRISGSAAHAGEARPNKEWSAPSPGGARDAALDVLSLESNQIEAIGLRTVPVRAQSEPVVLRLTGVTAYDPDTLTSVRS